MNASVKAKLNAMRVIPRLNRLFWISKLTQSYDFSYTWHLTLSQVKDEDLGGGYDLKVLAHLVQVLPAHLLTRISLQCIVKGAWF